MKRRYAPASVAARNSPTRWCRGSILLRARTKTAQVFPLLGTGGNDGRLEFTNNFMQRWQSRPFAAEPIVRNDRAVAGRRAVRRHVVDWGGRRSASSIPEASAGQWYTREV